MARQMRSLPTMKQNTAATNTKPQNRIHMIGPFTRKRYTVAEC